MAEGILQYKANKAGLNWQVDSAGTAGHQPGIEPHRLSQRVAKEHGIEIGNQQCRQLTKEDIPFFDRIFVMDRENFEDVKRISKDRWDESKVSLILNELYPDQNKEVPDPWYGTEKDYHIVFEMLDKACEKIVEKYT